jgi:hypothetical protein
MRGGLRRGLCGCWGFERYALGIGGSRRGRIMEDVDRCEGVNDEIELYVYNRFNGGI